MTSSQIPTVLLYAELFPILFIFNLTPTSCSGPACVSWLMPSGRKWERVNKFDMDFIFCKIASFLYPSTTELLTKEWTKFSNICSLCPESPDTLQASFTACANSHYMYFKKAFVCGFYLVIFYIFLSVDAIILLKKHWLKITKSMRYQPKKLG